MRPMRWGIVPAWWSKTVKDMRLATFNARVETVESKPMFKGAWAKGRRCIIPASGYYEWQTIGKEKQPWYFTPKDAPIVPIAGIWDEWKDRKNDTTVQSCAMIITEPSSMQPNKRPRLLVSRICGISRMR